MITRFEEINGNEYGYHPNNRTTSRSTYYGLSTDLKPTDNVNNADIFYEMDTKMAFLFDETNSAWLDQ